MTIKENAIYLAFPDKAIDKIISLENENKELKSELSDIKTAIRNYSKAETYQQQEITWESLLEFIN